MWEHHEDMDRKRSGMEGEVTSVARRRLCRSHLPARAGFNLLTPGSWGLGRALGRPVSTPVCRWVLQKGSSPWSRREKSLCMQMGRERRLAVAREIQTRRTKPACKVKFLETCNKEYFR